MQKKIAVCVRRMMKMRRYEPSRKGALEHFGFGTENMKKLKICPCCGNAQKVRNRLCDVCHTKLSGKTIFDIYKSKHRCCGNCGNVLPDDAEYCPLCGAKQKQ